MRPQQPGSPGASPAIPADQEAIAAAVTPPVTRGRSQPDGALVSGLEYFDHSQTCRLATPNPQSSMERHSDLAGMRARDRRQIGYAIRADSAICPRLQDQGSPPCSLFVNG